MFLSDEETLAKASPYHQLVSRYNLSRDLGTTAGLGFKEWSIQRQNETNDPLYQHGADNNLIKELSYGIDSLINATGLDRLGETVGGGVLGLFGETAGDWGASFGRGLARTAVDMAPMLATGGLGAIGATAGLLGSAALSGANAYTATNSPWAGAVSGVTTAAIPSIWRAGEQLGLRAIGTPTLAARAGLDDTAIGLLSGAERKAALQYMPSTLRQGAAAYGGGTLATGVASEVAEGVKALSEDVDYQFNPIHSALNMTVGQLPFGVLNIPKQGRQMLGGRTSRETIAKHTDELGVAYRDAKANQLLAEAKKEVDVVANSESDAQQAILALNEKLDSIENNRPLVQQVVEDALAGTKKEETETAVKKEPLASVKDETPTPTEGVTAMPEWQLREDEKNLTVRIKTDEPIPLTLDKSKTMASGDPYHIFVLGDTTLLQDADGNPLPPRTRISMFENKMSEAQKQQLAKGEPVTITHNDAFAVLRDNKVGPGGEPVTVPKAGEPVPENATQPLFEMLEDGTLQTTLPETQRLGEGESPFTPEELAQQRQESERRKFQDSFLPRLNDLLANYKNIVPKSWLEKLGDNHRDKVVVLEALVQLKDRLMNPVPDDTTPAQWLDALHKDISAVRELDEVIQETYGTTPLLKGDLQQSIARRTKTILNDAKNLHNVDNIQAAVQTMRQKIQQMVEVVEREAKTESAKEKQDQLNAFLELWQEPVTGMHEELATRNNELKAMMAKLGTKDFNIDVLHALQESATDIATRLQALRERQDLAMLVELSTNRQLSLFAPDSFDLKAAVDKYKGAKEEAAILQRGLQTTKWIDTVGNVQIDEAPVVQIKAADVIEAEPVPEKPAVVPETRAAKLELAASTFRSLVVKNDVLLRGFTVEMLSRDADYKNLVLAKLREGKDSQDPLTRLHALLVDAKGLTEADVADAIKGQAELIKLNPQEVAKAVAIHAVLRNKTAQGRVNALVGFDAALDAYEQLVQESFEDGDLSYEASKGLPTPPTITPGGRELEARHTGTLAEVVDSLRGLTPYDKFFDFIRKEFPSLFNSLTVQHHDNQYEYGIYAHKPGTLAHLIRVNFDIAITQKNPLHAVGEVVAHELSHALTVHRYNSDTVFRRQADALWRQGLLHVTPEIEKALKNWNEKGESLSEDKAIDAISYALSDPVEFLAQGITSPAVVAWAKGIKGKAGTPSLYSRMVNAIKAMFGRGKKVDESLWADLVRLAEEGGRSQEVYYNRLPFVQKLLVGQGFSADRAGEVAQILVGRQRELDSVQDAQERFFVANEASKHFVLVPDIVYENPLYKASNMDRDGVNALFDRAFIAVSANPDHLFLYKTFPGVLSYLVNRTEHQIHLASLGELMERADVAKAGGWQVANDKQKVWTESKRANERLAVRLNFFADAVKQASVLLTNMEPSLGLQEMLTEASKGNALLSKWMPEPVKKAAKGLSWLLTRAAGYEQTDPHFKQAFAPMHERSATSTGIVREVLDTFGLGETPFGVTAQLLKNKNFVKVANKALYELAKIGDDPKQTFTGQTASDVVNKLNIADPVTKTGLLAFLEQLKLANGKLLDAEIQLRHKSAVYTLATGLSGKQFTKEQALRIAELAMSGKDVSPVLTDKLQLDTVQRYVDNYNMAKTEGLENLAKNPYYVSAKRFGKYMVEAQLQGQNETVRWHADTPAELKAMAKHHGATLLYEPVAVPQKHGALQFQVFDQMIESAQKLERSRAQMIEQSGLFTPEQVDFLTNKAEVAEMLALEAKYSGLVTKGGKTRARRLSRGAEQVLYTENILSRATHTANYWATEAAKAETAFHLAQADMPADTKQLVETHVRNVLAPDPEVARIAARTATVYALGMAPASAISNGFSIFSRIMSESVRLTGSEWTGMTATLKALKDVTTGKLSTEEQTMLAQAVREGHVKASKYDVAETSHSALERTATTMAKPWRDGKPNRIEQAIDAAMWMFQQTEQLNNRVSLLNMYRIHRKTMEPKQAYQEALASNRFANDAGGKGGRSIGLFSSQDPIVRSGATLAHTLMTYTLGNFTQLGAYLKMGGKGANKAMAHALGMQLLATGLIGLPGASGLIAIIDSLFDTDTKENWRGYVDGALGDNIVSDTLTVGAPSALLGWDVGSRLSAGALPGVNEYSESPMVGILGAPYQMASQALDGFKQVLHGDLRGATKMTPPGLRKGLELLANEGRYLDSKHRPVMDGTAWENLGAMLGYTPLRLKEERQAARTKERLEQALAVEKFAFRQDMSAKLSQNRIGEVRLALQKKMKEDPLFDWKNEVRGIAETAEQLTFGRDLMRETNREAASALKPFAGVQRTPSEEARTLMKIEIERQLGLVTDSRKRLETAKQVDAIRRKYPNMTVAEIKRRLRLANETPASSLELQ